MKTKLKWILFVFVFALFAGCNLNNPPNLNEASQTGELVLELAMDQSRTLLPALSMEPATYRISGVCLGGDTFTRSTNESSMTITDLKFDTWTITVLAENLQGATIGSGTSTAVIHPGEKTIVSITVTPLTGTGSMSLSAFWNARDIEYPSIESRLIPPQGEEMDLNFSITDNTASYANNAILNGYYSLVVKLYDGNPQVVTPGLATGIVEVVRIVKDNVTEGTFDFTNLNQIGGKIQLSITPELADPITVAMSGQEEIIPLEGTMTVSASVPSETGNVVYVWYINGDSVGTDESITIDASEAGIYYLSVTAFTPDGKRGGSFTHVYHVE